MKFKTNSQLKKSKQGNVHFSFLSIHFGNRSFGIAILGFMVSIYLNQKKMSKEEVKYIVFAEDSTAMMQESLIQQSNPLTKERAIEFAERIKDRDYLFCVTIMKRVSKEELNQNKNE